MCLRLRKEYTVLDKPIFVYKTVRLHHPWTTFAGKRGRVFVSAFTPNTRAPQVVYENSYWATAYVPQDYLNHRNKHVGEYAAKEGYEGGTLMKYMINHHSVSLFQTTAGIYCYSHARHAAGLRRKGEYLLKCKVPKGTKIRKEIGRDSYAYSMVVEKLIPVEVIKGPTPTRDTYIRIPASVR